MQNINIRGSECQVSFSVDGQMIQGSFASVSDYTFKATLNDVKSDFVGELASRHDLSYDGVEFDGTVEHSGPEVIDLLNLIVARELARLPQPRIALILTLNFRQGPLVPSVTLMIQDAVVIIDGFAASSRKDYVKSKIAARAALAVQL
jgi:hypothetical protein